MEQIKKHLYIISDGTGETAATMIRAALVQYSDQDINIIRCKNIRTVEQLEPVIEDVAQKAGIITYTVVSSSFRLKIHELAASKGIPAVDLLGPLLNTLDKFFGLLNPTPEAGKLRIVDENYYKRIAAIEYTVRHDDGKCLTELDEADIILAGISRTSKTPMSIFLSHKGWKVANIPLVVGVTPPEELFKVDQRKIVGLIIDTDSLQRIRKNRLEKFGQDPGGEYASIQHILKEIEFANQLFKQNKRWPVFNVTERALEETASEIIRVVSSRMGYPERY